MVYELKDGTYESLVKLLEEIKKRKKEKKKKTLEKFYGCLKWDIDGVEYQRTMRSEWD